jgi:hypothetical protein
MKQVHTYQSQSFRMLQGAGATICNNDVILGSLRNDSITWEPKKGETEV